ncbi:hypothetical protein LWI28_013263 [Acer negundo]|uniref:Uncharacterized protein n=1 Tax=Acer negundo TaxID=4023 RepID=A0AAD5P5V1_ACENE|nr:hypothetical protein LWI28_013263 [Acer negundo]
MAAENEYREEDQYVTENVNVSEANNQPEYVNVKENVAEVDNLAMERYVPQNDEHIQQTENVVQNEDALDNEYLDQYLVYPRNMWAYDITITVHCKLKFINNIMRVLEDQGPQFVPLKDFVGKEDRVEPSSKQLHKKKQKRYHASDQPIKKRQKLFDTSPRIRTTQDVPDRPDLEPPHLGKTHFPLRHHSI